MANSEDNNKTAAADKKETAAISESVARDIKEGRLSTFIGNGTSLNGELGFLLMAHVDGHLSGKINSEKGTLIVGESGQVDAVVSVATGIIHGTINGDVIASEHLELKSTAKIIGNIQTPRLIMEDGAILEGKCTMLRAEDKAETRDVKPTAAPSVPAAAPTTAPATAPTTSPTTAAAAPKSSFVPVGDSQLKDKKPPVADRKNEDNPNVTLDVV